MKTWLPIYARPGPAARRRAAARRVCAALILAALAAGCGDTAPPSGAETDAVSEPPTEFTDTAGHPQEEYIQEGLARNLYRVPPDGRFRPDDAATCGEFAAALWYASGCPGGGEEAPVTDEAASETAMAWAASEGYLDGGAASDDYSPEAPITRQAAMDLLFACQGRSGGVELLLTGIYDNGFLDSGEIPEGGKPALYWGFYNVLIREPEPERIAPFGTVSRGDMAETMIRFMDAFLSGSPDE